MPILVIAVVLVVEVVVAEVVTEVISSVVISSEVLSVLTLVSSEKVTGLSVVVSSSGNREPTKPNPNITAITIIKVLNFFIL